MSNQILRSGTATAANYGEARGAESRSDFIQQLIDQSSLLPSEITAPIVAENDELCRIIAASIKTARSFGLESIADCKSEVDSFEIFGNEAMKQFRICNFQ